MGKMIALLIFLGGFIGQLNAFSNNRVERQPKSDQLRFENLTSGIYDQWNEMNPANVNSSQYSMIYGDGKLWLISNRELPLPPNMTAPASAANGGVVSTFDISTKTWSHKSYESVVKVEGYFGDRLFSMKGRLFLLVWDDDANGMKLVRLFNWNEQIGNWVEIPLTIDQKSVSALKKGSFGTNVEVSVPDQNGNMAYMAMTFHMSPKPPGILDRSICQLRIEFTEKTDQPIEADLKGIWRIDNKEEHILEYVAVHDKTIYVPVAQYSNPKGFQAQPVLYTMNMKTNEAGQVKTDENVLPPMELEDEAEENIFQAKNGRMYVFGGKRAIADSDEYDFINEIWVLDLKNGPKWKYTGWSIPANPKSTVIRYQEIAAVAFDQESNTVYVADLKTGIQAAQLPNGPKKWN